jgi:NAD-dependent dihydropyrimidine dehydrogenase PreA subunit
MKWRANRITYEYDEDKCTCGLGLCVEACGQGVLEYHEDSDKMEIVNTVQCIFCRQCEEVCPTSAISIEGALRIQDIRMGVGG